MSDLISRQAVLDGITASINQFGGRYTTDMLNMWGLFTQMIQEMPSAQPRGRWKRTYLDHEAMGERPSVFYCSECSQCIAFPTNYCPYCGARMEGER